MSPGRRELVVGTDVWFEGSHWRVQRIDANGVELTSGRAAVRDFRPNVLGSNADH